MTDTDTKKWAVVVQALRDLGDIETADFAAAHPPQYLEAVLNDKLSHIHALEVCLERSIGKCGDFCPQACTDCQLAQRLLTGTQAEGTRFELQELELRNAPHTWIPALLRALVETAEEKEVFKSGGLLAFVTKQQPRM